MLLARVLVLLCAAAFARAAAPKRVIIHADDLGATRSINAASVAALESGAIGSASLMPPCAWFPEIAAYARLHPRFDWGVHLTLTSERPSLRWGPVSPRGEVPSLVDADGYFHRTVDEAVAKIDPKEAEREIRAQIERAKKAGVRLTHLDSHQLLLYRDPRLTEILFRVAREYGLAVTQAVSDQDLDGLANIRRFRKPGEAAPGRTVSIGSWVAPGDWLDFYLGEARALRPGLTVFVVHLGYDDEEMRAFSADRESWGAAWRRRDFDAVSSLEFREALKRSGAVTTTWGRVAGREASK